MAFTNAEFPQFPRETSAPPRILTGSNVQRPHVAQEERARPDVRGQTQLHPGPFEPHGFDPNRSAEQVRLQVSSETVLSDCPFRQFHAHFASDQRGRQVSDSESWLQDALVELEQTDHEAREEGYPLSNMISRENAEHIITELARGSYPTPAIYPTEDGEIAILFQERAAKSGVLILCDRDGGAACFSTIADKKRRARYDDASELPDAFVRGELLKLRRSSLRS